MAATALRPRLPARHARQRARPSRGRRLRRRRARAERFGTPAYVYAEDDMRARARAYVEAFAARTDDFEVIYASKALPDHGRLPADGGGGPVGRRRLRRRALPRAARRRRSGADLHARQQQDRGRAAARLRRRHRLPGRSTRSPRSSWPSACSTGRAGRPDPGHARASSPPRTATSRPASSTRSSASASRTGSPREAVRARAARRSNLRPGRDPRAHRLADLRARAVREDDPAAGRLHRLRLPPAERRRRTRDRLHRATTSPPRSRTTPR